MNYIRYIPVVCVVGAIVGIIAYMQLWLHEVPGFDWTGNLTGPQLMDSVLDGFQKYLPTLICVLCVLSAAAAFATMLVRRFWYGIFVCLFLGVAVMAVTTIFSMWEVDGERIVHFIDLGFWLSYLAGALMMFGAAAQYTMLFRKPVVKAA